MCLVEKNNGSTFQRSLLPFIFHFVQPIDRASRHFQKSSSPFFFYLRHEFADQILRSSLNSSSIDRVDSYLNGDIVWRETTRRGKGTGREGKRERGEEREKGKRKRRGDVDLRSSTCHRAFTLITRGGGLITRIKISVKDLAAFVSYRRVYVGERAARMLAGPCTCAPL